MGRPRSSAPALAGDRAGSGGLWAVHESRVDFYEAEVLPGGCFFANAEFEFNARPGAIRDRLVVDARASG